MGVSISLEISEAVTKKEWEAVYEESLKLVECFHLGELAFKEVRGISVACLTNTGEHIFRRWRGDEGIVGWSASGDMDSMYYAEEYFTPRELVSEECYDACAGDALAGLAWVCFPYDSPERKEWKERWNTYKLWGAKTQGEPYHMYLLAVACLFCSRLGSKAYVHGDITRGQCRVAVRMANEHLDVPVSLPDQCCPDRFIARIRSLGLPGACAIGLFIRQYAGTLDAECGELIRTNFTTEEVDAYWMKRMKVTRIGTFGYEEELKKYLSMGFDLEDFCCRYTVFDYGEDNTKEEKTERAERFVKTIMDTEMYMDAPKDMEDPARIDKEQESSYTIERVFYNFGIMGAKNKRVDRYMPLDEMKTVLMKSAGARCDVERVIGECLDRKREAMEIDYDEAVKTEEAFGKALLADAAKTVAAVNRAKEKIQEDGEYDFRSFLYMDRSYKAGDTFSPAVGFVVWNVHNVAERTLKEDCYKQLMEGTSLERRKWLAGQNEHLMLRDTDWEKIFDDVDGHPESFRRYYGLMRVDTKNSDIRQAVRTLLVNDDLYGYVIEMEEPEGYGEEE